MGTTALQQPNILTQQPSTLLHNPHHYAQHIDDGLVWWYCFGRETAWTVGVTYYYRIDKNMENKHYPVKSFRIDDLTYKKLKKLRHKLRISYNLLLLDMYRQYNPEKRYRDKYQPYKQKDKSDNYMDMDNKN